MLQTPCTSFQGPVSSIKKAKVKHDKSCGLSFSEENDDCPTYIFGKY